MKCHKVPQKCIYINTFEHETFCTLKIDSLENPENENQAIYFIYCVKRNLKKEKEKYQSIHSLIRCS